MIQLNPINRKLQRRRNALEHDRTDWTCPMSQLYPIPGFPGYFLSPNGNVFSTRAPHSGGALRCLKPGKNSKGYLRVSLYRSDGTHAAITIHRLMALVFLPPKPSPAHQMRHLDGDKTNNHVDNLAWGTALDNAADKHVHGTDATGERHGSAKLTWEQVHEIRRRYCAGEINQKALAREMGVGHTTIRDIVKHRTWRARAALATDEGAANV